MACANDTFEEDLAELSSAEEFLEYFGIDFDGRVVQVNRLHILQRFHDYLAGARLRRLRRLQRSGRKGLCRLPEGRGVVVHAPLLADGLRPCCRAGTTAMRCA